MKNNMQTVKDFILSLDKDKNAYIDGVDCCLDLFSCNECLLLFETKKEQIKDYRIFLLDRIRKQSEIVVRFIFDTLKKFYPSISTFNFFDDGIFVIEEVKRNEIYYNIKNIVNGRDILFNSYKYEYGISENFSNIRKECKVCNHFDFLSKFPISYLDMLHQEIENDISHKIDTEIELRKKKEQEAEKNRKEYEEALSKLTKREQEILGITKY